MCCAHAKVPLALSDKSGGAKSGKDALAMTDRITVVPFGKYKDQPVEALIADRDYREWLMEQPWFRDRYVNLYQMVINYGGQPTETPEHNEMQAAFLDDDYCLKVARAIIAPKELEKPWWWDKEMPGQGWVPEPIERGFEVGGWDVVLQVGDHRFGIELKPDLGDDFPAVLRQVKNHSKGAFQRCVLVRRANFEKVTLEQVGRMFAISHIILLREQDL